MRSIFIWVACIVVALAGVSSAAVDKIEVLINTGMFSDYVAGAGTQTLAGTNGVYVYSDGAFSHSFAAADTSIGISFGDITDNSSGGVASADFDSGNWSVALSDAGSVVLSMSGTVDWYEELETAPNAVDGRGVVSLSSIYVDPVFWGTGASWGSTNGKSGVQTEISNATQTGGLTDYQTDWSSTNVRLIVWADSNAIPEPATIAIMALGSLALLRRRRR